MVEIHAYLPHSAVYVLLVVPSCTNVLSWYLLDFDNDISLVLYLRNWSVFDDDLAGSFEDHSFHSVVAHDDWYVLKSVLR